MVRAAREWVSFDDPDEERRWQVDVTFLLSRWQCIFGNGCQGVREEKAPELIQGCCTYGAHFTDKKDRDAVVKMARALDDDEWQFAKIGRKKGIYAKVGKNDDGSPDWRTRLVKGACVFLNRPGFGAGPGCALHQHSMRIGAHHSDWKPEVCWQLPLRRVDDEQEDGSVISTVTEFGRDGWGEGGEDFAWWCTEAPEAFTAADPVYRTLDVELRKMLGKKIHRSVVDYLDARLAAPGFAPVAHPAAVPVKITKKKQRAKT